MQANAGARTAACMRPLRAHRPPPVPARRRRSTPRCAVGLPAKDPPNLDQGNGHHQQQLWQRAERRLPDPTPLGLRPEQLPRHVAIIMDGNARWARERGLPVFRGHEAGVEALRSAVEAAAAYGVRALTVYALSDENFGRGAEEVSFLMDLFGRAIKDQLPDLAANGVRLRFVGRRERLPQPLQVAMASAEALTAGNRRLLLTVALSYGALSDVAAAARQLCAAVAAGAMRPEDITPEALAQRLTTAPTVAEAGPPDLLIRTSGTQRLSNFLLLECAYAELYFEPVLWPGFGAPQLEAALRHYAAQERRFGGRPAGAEAGGSSGSGGGG